MEGLMANKPNELPYAARTISFRAQSEIVRALDPEARKRFCSVSDVAREFVASDMRRRGLLEEAR
jgi:hypothetical protein